MSGRKPMQMFENTQITQMELGSSRLTNSRFDCATKRKSKSYFLAYIDKLTPES